MPFPLDDYTPYGCLANPAARARSWGEPLGGSLRTAADVLGLGWIYPWERSPHAVVELVLRLTVGERVYAERDAWRQLGLGSAYHSSQRLTFNWVAAGVTGEWRLFLAGADRLAGVVELHNTAPFERRCTIELLGRVHCESETPTVTPAADAWRLSAGEAAPDFMVRALPTAGPPPSAVQDTDEDCAPLAPAGRPSRLAGYRWTLTLAPGQRQQLAVGLSGADQPAIDDWPAAEAAALASDDAFYAGAPLLSGDWPASWRRGWIYDLETTRLCLRPAGGIFTDVWPTWMVHYPRVVVAEGTLDMLRLGYAAPDLAGRALLTLFRDAPAANVPCVFEGGEPNMVARDGSVCGTSPAWCLPFHNLEIFYRWTLDRAWLTAIYPHLGAYLDWWLTNRIDAEGWIVYQCTWEAGEDNSPRLDPAGEGDHVITEFTRPVELQAMMAVSAAVLSRFANELGRADEATRWAGVAADYRERTRSLWDDTEGRFRDWDKRTGGFVRPAGRATYWDADPCRYSPLSLTPLLDGVASPEQAERLEMELPAYDVSPWADWPSWTYTIIESAHAAGYDAFAARMAAAIIDRIYRRNDRRDLLGFARPHPGVAPEYWPTDVVTYGGSDGYGWGATTFSLLLRQVIGLTESAETGRWAVRLTPGLPPSLLIPGREYWLRNIGYRGRRFELGYLVEPDRRLTAIVRFVDRVGLAVETVPDLDAPPLPPRQLRPATDHRFPVDRGRTYQLVLIPTQTWLARGWRPTAE